MTLLRKLSALRAATILGLMMPVAAIPAASSASAATKDEELSSWLGTWNAGGTWLVVEVEDGRLTAKMYEAEKYDTDGRTGYGEPALWATLIVDKSRSDATKLVGFAQSVGNTSQSSDFEFRRSSGGAALIGFIRDTRGAYPYSAQRVSSIGAFAPVRSVDQIIIAMKGIWRTPLGRLTIGLAPRGSDGNQLEGQLVDLSSGKLLQRLEVTISESGFQDWDWIDAAGSDPSDSLALLSPDGQQLLVGAEYLDNAPDPRMRWILTQYGAPQEPSTPNNPIPSGGSQPQPPVGTPPAQQPGPVTPGPLPQNPPGPVQAPPSSVGAFKPLNRIDVRVDRVVVARGYPTYQVHAFVTVKNTSASPQYFTSGFMKAVLADADGVSWERSQPYSASREPAALFAETPVIQPGGELKVRYVFTPPEDAALTTLTLSEAGKSAQFQVGGL